MRKGLNVGSVCAVLAVSLLPACRGDTLTPNGVLEYVYGALMSNHPKRVLRRLAKGSELRKKYSSDPTALADLRWDLDVILEQCAGRKFEAGIPGEPVAREVDRQGGRWWKWKYLFKTYEVPVFLVDSATKAKEVVAEAVVVCIQDLGRDERSYDRRRRLFDQGVPEGDLVERSFPLWAGCSQGPCVIREFELRKDVAQACRALDSPVSDPVEFGADLVPPA